MCCLCAVAAAAPPPVEASDSMSTTEAAANKQLACAAAAAAGCMHVRRVPSSDDTHNTMHNNKLRPAAPSICLKVYYHNETIQNA